MKAQYFPIERGVYEVAPGLRPLGTDFGNGGLDHKIFQIEPDFGRFRANKLECRKERLGKYRVERDLPAETAREATLFILRRLPQEWPDLFRLLENDEGFQLFCEHTGDRIRTDRDGHLLAFEGDVTPAPVETLDALSLQIAEDFALLARRDRVDRLAYLNLCSPSHWSAEDKIGMNFSDVHRPIPGIDRILRTADNMVEAMISKGPFVRFVWSFVTDDRLNHHPSAPEGWDQAAWKGRSFDGSLDNPFRLRIERQITHGLPTVESALFTIKVSFWTGLEIKEDATKKSQLLSALRSMTPESRVYKGVAHCFDELVAWLETP